MAVPKVHFALSIRCEFGNETLDSMKLGNFLKKRASQRTLSLVFVSYVLFVYVCMYVCVYVCVSVLLPCHDIWTK